MYNKFIDFTKSIKSIKYIETKLYRLLNYKKLL